MASVAPVQNNNNLYKDFIVQKTPMNQQPAVSIKSAGSDTFNDKTNNKTGLLKLKDYLFEPIDNPNYFDYAQNQRPKTTRFKKILGAALSALFYSFFIFYMVKTVKMAGVTLKPESASSFMEKYKENLSHASNLDELALPDVLRDMVARLLNKINDPETFIQKGGTNKNTILLYGPPGTGKTTVAKAIAKEIENAELFSVDLSTIQGKYVGESEANLDKIINNICKYAKENVGKKIVVLMDEFDSVAIKDNGSSNQQYHASLLNVLKRAISEKLTQQDNIILIATTNAELNKVSYTGEFVQKLDTAMADRFGEQIRVDRPSKDQFIKAIANHYKKLTRVSDELKDETNENVIKIATELKNNECSFRTLENLFNASASQSHGDILTPEDVLTSLSGLIQGLENNNYKF
jgi:AAA+ superfamily predicted ATPase